MPPAAAEDVELGPEIVDGCLARLASPHRFEAVGVSLDGEYLRYLDAALAEVAAHDARLAEPAPDPPALRSAAADILVAKALDVRAGGQGHVPGAGIERALAGDISNVLLDGLVRRLGSPPQPPPTHVDLLLSHETRGRLDTELHYLVEVCIYPEDQPYYRGDGSPDLRSAFVEAVLVTWLVWTCRGEGPARRVCAESCARPDTGGWRR
ncbi:MAG: hypothetical protein GXY03_09605 [Solirubrobacterales bacterium]|nr:hypothetical protein [Solirubrobacterales bacterium]